MDTITFERVSGSEQNLVGVFYVWNVGLVLKCKVKSWSWSWSSSWTGFWLKKNFVERHQILWVRLKQKALLLLLISLVESWSWSWKKNKSEKILWNKTEFHERHQHVKHNFWINDYQKLYPDPDRNLTESKNRLKLIDWKLLKSIITHSLV